MHRTDEPRADQGRPNPCHTPPAFPELTNFGQSTLMNIAILTDSSIGEEMPMKIDVVRRVTVEVQRG